LRAGKPVRTKGSHEIWQLEGGRTFVAVRNHLGAGVPASIVSQFRRVPAR
jgi:predicted RNA binding protein YcfA (HicA-like mRNA interferase family)